MTITVPVAVALSSSMTYLNFMGILKNHLNGFLWILIQQAIGFRSSFKREAVGDPLFGADALQGAPGHFEAAGFVPAAGKLGRDGADLAGDESDPRAVETAAQVKFAALFA